MDRICIQCITKLLIVCYVHIHITRTAIKNAQNACPEDNIGFLKLFLIFIRYSSFVHVFTNIEHFQSFKPELTSHLPVLKVHTGELIRPYKIAYN